MAGSAEEEPDVFFAVPEGLKPKPGDIVEIRAGRRPKGGNVPGKANTATPIVQKRNEAGQCDWVSKERFLRWNSILFCDWMPAEHWTSPARKCWMWAAAQRNLIFTTAVKH